MMKVFVELIIGISLSMAISVIIISGLKYISAEPDKELRMQTC